MATDFLTTKEKTLFTDDFNDLISDASVGVSITYRPFSSKAAFAPSSGRVAETYSTDQTINAFRVPVSDREVELSNGKYQVGDWRYMIRVVDVSTVKKDDRLIDSGITRYIVNFNHDSLRIYHSIVARNLG